MVPQKLPLWPNTQEVLKPLFYKYDQNPRPSYMGVAPGAKTPIVQGIVQWMNNISLKVALKNLSRKLSLIAIIWLRNLSSWDRIPKGIKITQYNYNCEVDILFLSNNDLTYRCKNYFFISAMNNNFTFLFFSSVFGGRKGKQIEEREEKEEGRRTWNRRDEPVGILRSSQASEEKEERGQGCVI